MCITHLLYWYIFRFYRRWTLRSKITSRGFSTSRRTGMVTGSGLLVTWDLEVLLVLLPFSLCTLLTMHVPVSPMTPRQPRKEVKGSSMVLLMSTRRLSSLMVLLGFTVDSTSPVLVSLSTVVSTLVCTTLWSLFSLLTSRFVYLISILETQSWLVLFVSYVVVCVSFG